MAVELPNGRSVFLPDIPSSVDTPEKLRNYLKELSEALESSLLRGWDNVYSVAREASSATGDVLGPLTHSANYIPQWSGDSTRVLKEGLAAGTSAGNLLLISASGQIPTNLIDGASITSIGATNIVGFIPASLIPNNYLHMQVFTADGTFVKSSGVSVVFVEMVGAGGGTPVSGVCGGGAGGYCAKVCTITTDVAVTVGTGVYTGGGSVSAFGTFCTAGGGAVGIYSTVDSYAVGGTGSGGDINLEGEPGIALRILSSASSWIMLRKAGNSRFGYGGMGITTGATGGGYGQGVNTQAGSGYPGIVIVRW